MFVKIKSVTHHAIQRYRERTGSKRDDVTITANILKQLSTAEEYVLKKKFRTIELLNHNFEDTRYFRTGNGSIIVIVDGVVKTIHNGKANRWKRK